MQTVLYSELTSCFLADLEVVIVFDMQCVKGLTVPVRERARGWLDDIWALPVAEGPAEVLLTHRRLGGTEGRSGLTALGQPLARFVYRPTGGPMMWSLGWNRKKVLLGTTEDMSGEKQTICSKSEPYWTGQADCCHQLSHRRHVVESWP